MSITVRGGTPSARRTHTPVAKIMKPDLGHTRPRDRQLHHWGVAGVIPPRPTAAARDEAGNPLNRDEYAALLRARVTGEDRPMGGTLSTAHAAVAARLLDDPARDAIGGS